MLRENQVRARIRACKDEIKWQKIYLDCKINDNESYRYAKAEIRYQKEKLKRLRRELPMRAKKGLWLDGYYDLHCPICDDDVGTCDDYSYDVQIFNYCPHCGQRVRE